MFGEGAEVNAGILFCVTVSCCKAGEMEISSVKGIVLK